MLTFHTVNTSAVGVAVPPEYVELICEPNIPTGSRVASFSMVMLPGRPLATVTFIVYGGRGPALIAARVALSTDADQVPGLNRVLFMVSIICPTSGLQVC